MHDDPTRMMGQPNGGGDHQPRGNLRLVVAGLVAVIVGLLFAIVVIANGDSGGSDTASSISSETTTLSTDTSGSTETTATTSEPTETTGSTSTSTETTSTTPTTPTTTETEGESGGIEAP